MDSNASYAAEVERNVTMPFVAENPPIPTSKSPMSALFEVWGVITESFLML
jgi:hypothetical protein